MGLALDLPDTGRISDPGAQARAEAFLAARGRWRVAQRALAAPPPEGISAADRAKQLDVLTHTLLEAYADFTNARDAIRAVDDPGFLGLQPTPTDLVRALEGPGDALVYLVAAEQSGFALVVSLGAGSNVSVVEHVPLRALTDHAVVELLEQRAGLSNEEQGQAAEQRVAVSGGLAQAQFGWAFGHLQGWGPSLLDALDHLPPQSGFAVAGQALMHRLNGDLISLALLTTRFASLTDAARAQLDTAFTQHLLRVELKRTLHELGRLGVSDLADWLQQHGVQRLTLIPYGSLGLFPWPSMPVGAADGMDRPLGEVFEITVVPNADALETARQRARAVDPIRRPMLVTVGDPKPTPSHVTALPYAQAEAEAARTAALELGYPAGAVQCLTAEEASKARVVSALENAWYAHLAVHGLYRADAPRQSHLLLAGSDDAPEQGRLLTLEECLNGDIDLVGLRLLILSACETSIIDVQRAANEVVGLASGFLQAGAAGVIAALWPVDDRATYLLMSRFAQLYLDSTRGWSPARCLAEAQRWLREEATNRVLATYDLATVSLTTAPRARSLRHSYATAQELVHIQAQAAADPDALPYADPTYWAAFTVTGC